METCKNCGETNIDDRHECEKCNPVLKKDWKNKMGSLLGNGVGSLLLGILFFVLAFYMRDYHVDCGCGWQTFTHVIFMFGVLLYMIAFLCIVFHIEKEQNKKRGDR